MLNMQHFPARRSSWIRSSRLVLLSATMACLMAGVPGQAQQDEAANQAKAAVPEPQLKISGTVTSMQMVQDERSVKLRLGINVVAENTSKEDLILLRRTPDASGEYLFGSATADQPLWGNSHPAPEARNERKGDNLQKGLDQKEPPDDSTIILNPGDTIGWDMPVELTIAKTAEPPAGTTPRPAWDTVRKSCPCFLKLDVDLWPASIEPKADAENPAFARKLAGRWKKKGRLVYAQQRSEAIPLNLQQAAR